MKKNTIKERIENAIDAFFDNKGLSENNALDFASEKSLFNEAIFDSKSKKLETIQNLLKQVFLFFPGAVILFSLSMMIVYISIIQSYITVILDKPLQLFLGLLFSYFMVWLGLGNIRKPKDTIIPLSVVGFGVLVGAISGIISIIDLRLIHKIFSDSGYPFYFLPLALTIPFIVKMWIEKSDTEKFDI